MPDMACDNLCPDNGRFPRPVAPDHPFDDLPSRVRSELPYMVAGMLASLGFRVMPVHGIIPTPNGFECDCQESARRRAKKEGETVLACTMPGKKPRLKNWPELATTDFKQIAAWLSRRKGGMPTSNFAAVTGTKSGFWVLDIDGSLGFESLDAVQAAIGQLPRTWTSISGSGQGAHFWWKLPPGVVVRNSANQLASKIDVRGENGQIVLPGSRHKSGNRYMWAEGCAPDETPLVDAPPALLKLALEACKKTREPRSVGIPPRPKRDGSAQILKPRNRHHAQGVFGIIGDGPGRRGFHAAINSVACSFFAKFGHEADSQKLKAKLMEVIPSAPTIGREPGYAARYADPAYLDPAIESARAFILEQK